MTLGVKERKELVSVTMERLTSVIGASGKSEELVRLTTQIVQAAKRLAEDTPEPTKTRSTGVLAEFVIAAKKIAQNVRAVDSTSLQQLSSTRKAVESLVKELDGWHEAQISKQQPQAVSQEPSLEEILAQTNSISRQESRSSFASGKGSPPTESPVSEQEKRLGAELKRQLEVLQRKTEPQSNPEQHGNPEEILRTAVGGITRSTKELIELSGPGASGQKAPSRETLLEPTVLLAKMVSMLMDLVDSLFVSKFPMRSQVHSFSCMLIENTLSYNEHGKSEAAAALRLISTQVPALKSALEVMVEQCATRSQNIRESQQMSIQRNVDLHDLDRFGPRHSPANRRKAEPPLPPNKKKQDEPQKPVEFEIVCMICTSMAINSETGEVMSKGTDLTLKAVGDKTVLEVRKLLSKRTGLPLDHIQLRFRGDDVLFDEFKVTKDNSGPFFVFNIYEPGEEEVQEFKKRQKRKNRVKIGDDHWWTLAPSPLAVAMFDYEAFGEEEDTLEFEEGDLIEIVEKSPDGWWTGKIDNTVGDFPASFVEEIPVPKSKDEAKKLFKKFKHGKLGHDANQTESRSNAVTPVDDFSEPPERPSQPPQLHSTASVPGHKPSPKLGGFMRRIHSSSSTSHSAGHSDSPSPSPIDPGDRRLTKAQRMASEPVFSGLEQPKDKDKKSGSKRLSLLKKKKHTSSYAPLSEDFESASDRLAAPRSPILSPPDRKGGTAHSDLEGISETRPQAPANGVGVGSALGGVTKRLSRPVSSPRMSRLSESPTKSPPKGAFTQSLPPPTAPPTVLSAPITSSAASTSGGGGGGGSVRKPVRPPPPPPPYARTHGRTGMKVLLITSKDDSDSGGEEGRESVSPAPKRDDAVTSPPITMQAPSTTPTIEEEGSIEQEEGDLEKEKEQKEVVEDISPTKASQSMEDLFKDLEEFDELSSLSLPNGLHNLNKGERDFATIPRSELPVRRDEEAVGLTAQSPADTPTPDICVTDEKGASSQTSSPEEQPRQQDAPAKPPRTKKKQKPQQQQQQQGEPGSGGVIPPPSSVEKPVSPVPPSAKPQVAATKPFHAPPPPPSKPPQTMIPAAKPQPPPSKPQLPPPITKPTTQNGLKDEVPPSASSSTAKEIGTSNTVPKAPPRRRSKKMTERMAMYEKKDESLPMPGNVSSKSGKTSPIPPSKPKFLKKTHLESLDRPACSSAPVSRTASPDDRHGLAAARGKDASNSSENIGPDMNPNRSPVVMRRAGDVGSRRDPSFSDDDLEDCTGVGKEGVLHKEGAKSSNWKARYFVLRETCLVYFESKPLSKSMKVLGEIPASRMQGAVIVGDKNNFHCFGINMRYDTTVVLGCKKQTEIDDWVRSINKMIKDAKSEVRAKTFEPSYNTALKCLTYLSEDRHVAESRAFVILSGNREKIKGWLECVDRGEEPDLTDIPDSATAVGLLKALFNQSRIGALVEHGLAKELCETTKSSDPISILGSKMEELAPDLRSLLKELLRVFNKVLAHTDKNQTTVQDLNHSFGPLIFEKVAIAQSESLLAYLISTCEFIIS